MSIYELIAIRDFLTASMCDAGDYNFETNPLVASIQAAIDQSFFELTGVAA